MSLRYCTDQVLKILLRLVTDIWIAIRQYVAPGHPVLHGGRLQLCRKGICGVLCQWHTIGLWIVTSLRTLIAIECRHGGNRKNYLTRCLWTVES